MYRRVFFYKYVLAELISLLPLNFLTFIGEINNKKVIFFRKLKHVSLIHSSKVQLEYILNFEDDIDFS